jgi:hypothetical protein
LPPTIYAALAGIEGVSEMRLPELRRVTSNRCHRVKVDC